MSYYVIRTLNNIAKLALLSLVVLVFSVLATRADAFDTSITPTNANLATPLTFSKDQFPELYCLALNIYHEARGSNLADQFAVADVVINRVNDRRYPDTICKVVYQGKQRPSWKDPNIMVMVRNMCQFSWYCDGRSDTPNDIEAWKRAQTIAWSIVKWGDFRGLTEGATHYHTTAINPSWNKSKKGFSITRIGQIGSHIYYRWN